MTHNITVSVTESDTEWLKLHKGDINMRPTKLLRRAIEQERRIEKGEMTENYREVKQNRDKLSRIVEMFQAFLESNPELQDRFTIHSAKFLQTTTQ